MLYLDSISSYAALENPWLLLYTKQNIRKYTTPWNKDFIYVYTD